MRRPQCCIPMTHECWIVDKIKATLIDFTVPVHLFFLMYMDVIEAKHFSGVCVSWCEQDHPNPSPHQRGKPASFLFCNGWQSPKTEVGKYPKTLILVIRYELSLIHEHSEVPRNNTSQCVPASLPVINALDSAVSAWRYVARCYRKLIV